MVPGMDPSLTDTLCTRCGLCCDGSLLADVELAGPAEAQRALLLGLRVDDDSEEPVMLLPCSALEGTRCSVYALRPRTCRSFECGLLMDVRAGIVPVERALEHVSDARERIAQVRALLARSPGDEPSLPLRERCAEALSAEPGSSARALERRARLEQAIGTLQALLDARFLGGRPARRPRA